MRIRPWLLLTFFGLLGFAAWYLKPWADPRPSLALIDAVAAESEHNRYTEVSLGYTAQPVVQGLELPWDVAFLGDTEILVTEKVGRLTRIHLQTGERSAITGMPAVTVHGQGGLHAVVLHPDFATNGWLYLSYAAPAPAGGYTTHFTRARLQGSALTEQKLLLQAQANTGKGQHFGGAMVFDRDGFLFLCVGDRGERDDAQNLGRHNGKILRLHDDGRVPTDNPFVKVAGALPEIYSYGHRNPQGMDLDAATNQIWAVEHGPRGGDEINRVLPGRNYGWPVITYGKEYVGGKIGEGAAKDGMEQPVHYYVPSIATGGMAYYAGAAFPQWQGSVFVAALRGHLNRVQLKDGRYVKEERLLTDQHLRVRSVRISPSGELWVVADDGVILKLGKAKS
ncbi:MAG: PQQ-dependent sugar dehydrogenase [Panacagrimonas sp.]